MITTRSEDVRLLTEAENILAGRTLMLPTREHLRALVSRIHELEMDLDWDDQCFRPQTHEELAQLEYETIAREDALRDQDAERFEDMDLHESEGHQW